MGKTNKKQTVHTKNKNTFINELLYVFIHTFYVQTKNPAPKLEQGFYMGKQYVYLFLNFIFVQDGSELHKNKEKTNKC